MVLRSESVIHGALLPYCESRAAEIVMALLACASQLYGACGAAADEPPADERCALEAGPSHTVARIVDAETIVVDDGSEVRLIGALAPRSPSPGAADWPPERAAREALERLLARPQRRAQVCGAAERPLWAPAGSRLRCRRSAKRSGFRGVCSRRGSSECMRSPATPRASPKCWRWKAKARGVRGASGLSRPTGCSRRPIVGELLRRRNRLEVVEGVVRDVAFTGGRVYLNFGATGAATSRPSCRPASCADRRRRSRASRHSSARVLGCAAGSSGATARRSRLRPWAKSRLDGPGEAENEKRPVVAQPGAPDQ